MYLYKINNLKQLTGNLDYKGLDLSQIVAGTQVYPHDFEADNTCLLGSLEEHKHDDVLLLNDAQYAAEKKRIESEYPVVETEESKLEKLEAENAELKLAMVEMAESQMAAQMCFVQMPKHIK
ncbi:hypothetical protein LGW94_10235 [Streptococcus mutans]|nr:hypothetical protein [Streptococcus mutans]